MVDEEKSLGSGSFKVSINRACILVRSCSSYSSSPELSINTRGIRGEIITGRRGPEPGPPVANSSVYSGFLGNLASIFIILICQYILKKRL